MKDKNTGVVMQQTSGCPTSQPSFCFTITNPNQVRPTVALELADLSKRFRR